jgi:gamma-glutamyl:cysteine ligase YbdK (ATP-grasp superfamily)
MTSAPLGLFEGFGVELEYMIVDAHTLDVRPISDRVLCAVAGSYVSEHELGALAWSNELALHVIELKTNGPAESLSPLAERFQGHVRQINEILAPLGARLMPTAMHPWMRPEAELKLWPHEYNAVYEAFHRIFDCRGHGWANLQSVHLNLPFADDEQFGRLHAAIRLLLPILPALAASSPVVERRLTGLADNRLDVYRGNCRRVPLVTANVVPEGVFTRNEYDDQILKAMYRQIAPLDPEGTLQHEWLNARGAIARFERQTIEIRVLDVQECPAADLAICQAVVGVLEALIAERWSSVARQQSAGVASLAETLTATIRDAEGAVMTDREYLGHFGIKLPGISAGDLWRHLMKQIGALESDPALSIILGEGPLARRIERALHGDLSRLEAVYGHLCECLAEGRMFTAHGC